MYLKDPADSLTATCRFAAIHPPSASMNCLLWNLLHNPEHMDQAVIELDKAMPAMTSHRAAYTQSEVDQNLPWLKACIKESFRITPAFTMPLTRRIVTDGIVLNEKETPKGVRACASNKLFNANVNICRPMWLYVTTHFTIIRRYSARIMTHMILHGGRKSRAKALLNS